MGTKALDGETMTPGIAKTRSRPKFTVLIGSIGRPSLRRSLESIASQDLIPGDQVIVGFDAFEQRIEDLNERVRLVHDFGFDAVAFDAGYHWLGVEQINFAMREVDMTGTHIFTIGDDDVFVPGAYAVLRDFVSIAPERPLLYRFIAPNGAMLWDRPRLRPCLISGCCIAAPKEYVGQMHTRRETTHDYDWMIDIRDKALMDGNYVRWLDYVGVIARPEGVDYPPIMRPEWIREPMIVEECYA